MSVPNQPQQPGPWGPPQQQGPAGAPGWGQPNSAWGQPNQAWGGQPNQAWGAPPNAEGGWQAPAAPRYQPGEPEPQQDSAPFGRQQQPTVTIEQFKPPRNRLLPILVVVVLVAVVTGLLYFGLRPDPIGQGGTPSPGSSPSASSSPRRTITPPPPGEFATETLFESDRVAGLFKLNSSHWEGDTLVADVTIEVDRGSISYAFFTMDMATGDVYEPDLPMQTTDLEGGLVEAGESVTGTVRITKPRGDTQLILSDLAGRNLTMLAIKG